ncbi:hypothetical protein FZ025_00440 [Xanthomonas hyacinthi]|uniref:hypothetical protein n=1 Tax=Xanthomonas hyacinthi TaxID=56455 RepID=UPI0011B096CC|nr:hypothetical protein [Xanthomonas hyacinthi]QGY75216.1 hypothetical protein FZ025_00440 [Xanthomonas hyacinthi]
MNFLIVPILFLENSRLYQIVGDFYLLFLVRCMKIVSLVVLPLFCSSFLLVGCVSQVESVPVEIQKGEIAASNKIQSKEPATLPDSSKDSVAAVVPVGLKEGMAYGDLRSILISGNWVPKSHPDCKRSVIGADFDKVCSSDPNLCKECDDLPELSECSGDGHCLMEFSDAGGRQVLTVATYGDIKDAKVESEESGLRVSWWDAKSKK